MKCAAHNDLDAVSTCQSCGKGLCPTCTNQFEKPFCQPCAVEENRAAIRHNQALIREATKPMLWAGILFLLALLFLISNMGAQNLPVVLGLSAVVAMTPAGWKFLSRIFNPGGHYMHMSSRWISAICHLGASMMLGVIVGPIQMLMSLNEIKKLKQINAEIIASGHI